ncbi:hypothetical protein EON81_21790, partial [bacterium]
MFHAMSRGPRRDRLPPVSEVYDVILPAGGTLDDHFAKVALTPVKALIRTGDNLLIFRALEALRLSGRSGRIVVVGGAEVKKAMEGRVDAIVPAGPSLPDNILKGLKELLAMENPPQRLLIVTTDLAYIDDKVLAKWLDTCPPGADFCGALVDRVAYEDRFPGSSSTWVKLADGHFTLGGVFLVKTDALRRAMPQIERVVAQRKSVRGMAGLLGFGFLIKVMTRRITVAECEAKVEEILGAKVSAVPDAPPELAFDVDDIEDYE